jgi:hypothetical protein
MLQTEHVQQAPADPPSVHAFRIEGGVGADEMAAVAERLEAAFDRHEEVSILLMLEGFDLADAISSLSLRSLVAQARSAAHVKRYAVVGAPPTAAWMIETFDKASSIEAAAFAPGQEAAAWDFVRARPRG